MNYYSERKFREMKGQDIFIEMIREEVPDIEQAREEVIREATFYSQNNKPHYMRWIAASAAAVAVICLVIIGSIQLYSPDSADVPAETGSIQASSDNNPGSQSNIQIPASSRPVEIDVSAIPAGHGDNAFSLLAYIPEQQGDDIDGVGDEAGVPNGWIELTDYFEFDREYQSYSIMSGSSDPRIPGYYFNQALHRSIFIKCEGENIASVEFRVDEGGSFIKASVLTENGVPVIHDDRSFTIVAQQSLGSGFTLNSITDITEDFLLFVGKSFPDGEQAFDFILPELNLTVRVTATFTDGSTQEITIAVN